MLTLHTIRTNPEAVITALAKRNINARPAIESLLALNEQRRRIQTETETLQAEANRLAKEIGGLMRDGRADEAVTVKARTTEIKSHIQGFASELELLEGQEREHLLRLPNMPHDSVPAGKSAEDNVVVSEWNAYVNVFITVCRRTALLVRWPMTFMRSWRHLPTLVFPKATLFLLPTWFMPVPI